MNIKIISQPTEENPFCLLYKPAGLPSAPLFEGDSSALTEAITIFPELKKVTSMGTKRKEVEHGLVHRIDTATRGLLLIASTNESFSWFLDCQEKGEFKKGYRALCAYDRDAVPKEGFPEECFTSEIVLTCMRKYTVNSRFRPFGSNNSQVRPVTEASSRQIQQKASPCNYRTDVSFTQLEKNIFRADCSIVKGYRHQVRCHLAWLGFPIIGDPLYNTKTKAGDQFFFEASSLSFPHPLTGEKTDFSLPEDFHNL